VCAGMNNARALRHMGARNDCKALSQMNNVRSVRAVIIGAARGSWSWKDGMAVVVERVGTHVQVLFSAQHADSLPVVL
jgi:hypothetical protein